MDKKSKVFYDYADVVLNNIIFNLCEKQDTNAGILKDNFNIIEKSKEELHLLYTRDFNATSFHLTVKMDVYRYPVKNKEFNVDELTGTFIKKNIDDILDIAPSIMSNLISNITGVTYRAPIITPPAFIEK